eukprot:scaffold116095_cov24-Tisochrysis_lutea.AAC.1
MLACALAGRIMTAGNHCGPCQEDHAGMFAPCSEESPMSDHSQGYLSEDDAEGMGRRVSTRDDGNDLMGMVHLAAAAMVTALAQWGAEAGFRLCGTV